MTNRPSSGVRPAIRHVTLSGFGLAYEKCGRIAAGLRRNRVQLLCFHEVTDNERGVFRTLLRRLAVDHRLISYSEAVSRIGTANIDWPYIAFSVDDGLKSGWPAAEVLEEFGVSACFFVCPEVVGETDPSRVAWFCRARLGLPAALDLLNWADLEALLKRGHEVGSHTMTHACLRGSSAAELHDEIAGSREVLRRRIGRANHFAWPFGQCRQFSAAAARSVLKSGYLSCASGRRGCHVNDGPTPVFLHRDNIVAGWPLDHSLFLLAWNANRAAIRTATWPRDWGHAPDIRRAEIASHREAAGFRESV